MQVLAFQRQGCLFALPLASVREIKTVHEIARIKSVVRELRGICTVGGRCMPVIDLVDHHSIATRDVSTRLIVVSQGARHFAVVYDKVLEICRLRPSRIVPAVDGYGTWPTFGLEQRQVAFVEPSCLLDTIESSSFDTVSGVFAGQSAG